MTGKAGLSKFSPLNKVLKLTRDNYEALIARHGQVCRWVAGDKCPCVLDSGRTDPNCPYCQGDGWVYRFRTSVKKTRMRAFPGAMDTFEVRDLGGGPILSVDRVSSGTCTEIFNDRYLRISGVPHGMPVEVDYNESRLFKGSFAARYAGGNYLQINSFQSAGEMDLPNELFSIQSLRNLTQGVSYTVHKTVSNWIEIQPPVVPIAPGDNIQAEVNYLVHPTFLVQKQFENKLMTDFLQSIGGDAVVSFPACYEVAEGDLITTLSSSVVRKTLRTKAAGDSDTVPDFFALRILEIRDNSGKNYTPDVDYTLAFANQILWASSNRPTEGSTYLVTYEACPTYRVLRELPNTRNPESQNMPGTVAVKLLLWGTGKEALF